MRQQPLHHGIVTSLRGPVERRAPVRVQTVNVCPILQEFLHNLRVAVSRCVVQRREAGLVDGIDVCPVLAKCFCDCLVS